MLLKKGSTGEDVKKLQSKLGLTADGSFGPGTEAKVKEFQASNGLTADGVVGNGTWSKMFPAVETPAAAAPAAPTQVVSTTTTSTNGLNLSKLKGHIPDAVISQIPAVMETFGIDTATKLAHFLSQCGHESAGFKVVNENLNYSKDGLRKIFGKYFTTDEIATRYARQPEKIANRVYGNRMGNGAEASGDGWKHRGRGYIQLTGKDNYTAFGKAIGVDILANPDLVATQYPLMSAAWFFSKNCLRKCVDASPATVKSVTLCVNGGTIGLEDRQKHFNEYYALLK
jgi:putative chitinase